MTISSAILEAMAAAGVSIEQIISVVKADEAAPPPPKVLGPRAGALNRWGYDGPVTPRLPEREWIPLVVSVLRRDHGVCRYCGEMAKTADHVVPLSRGGSNCASNLVAACLPCNNSKGDFLLSEWRGRSTARRQAS